MRKIAFLAAVIGFLFVVAPNTLACSCSLPTLEPLQKQVKTAVKKSRAVFSGTVTDIDEVRHESGYVSFKVEFRLERSWKGPRIEQIIIGTGGGGGDCGYRFE